MSAVTRHIYFTTESWDKLNEFALAHDLTPSTAIRQLIETSIEVAEQIQFLTAHRDALAKRQLILSEPFACPRCSAKIQHPHVF